MSLARNSLLLTGTKFIEKFCALGVILFASRMLGDSGVGEFFYYFNMASLLIPLMDMGFSKVFQQEWYRRQEPPRDFLGQMLGLRLDLGLLSWGILLVADRVVQHGPGNPLAVSAAFLAVFLERYGELLRSPANVREKFGLETFVPVFSRLLNIALLFYAADRITHGYQLAWLYVIANGAGCLISLAGLRSCPPSFRGLFNLRRAGRIVVTGAPFSLTAVFVMISLNIDSVMLGRISFAQVGAYNVSYRILLVVLVLSGGACQALFPRILRFRSEGRQNELGWFLQGIFQGFIMIFGMIMVGGIAVGEKLIPFLFGAEFIESGRVFVMMCPLILLSALTNLLGQSLEAVERQRTVLVINMFSAMFNVGANLLLIPRLGMYGAAMATLLTESLTLLQMGCLVRSLPAFKPMVSGTWKSLLFVGVCGAAFVPLRGREILLALPAGAGMGGVLLLAAYPLWPDALRVTFRKILKRGAV